MAADFSWALKIAARYDVAADLTYRTVDGVEVRLDVYRPFENQGARPTLMFMHGGGWAAGSTKETWSLWFLPFLQLGWVVVNVGYRHSSIATAPAAVEDCFEALRWLGQNAAGHQMDLEQLVLAGLSAGGHLALLTGMRAPQGPRPRAIINWCGPTDLDDLVSGAHRQDFAVQFLGDPKHARSLARELSPLTHVRPGVPAVITLHGDQDDIVPFDHALRLHEALASAGVVNELVPLPGARHASLEAYLNAYPKVFEFLERAGVSVRPVLVQ